MINKGKVCRAQAAPLRTGSACGLYDCPYGMRISCHAHLGPCTSSRAFAPDQGTDKIHCSVALDQSTGNIDCAFASSRCKDTCHQHTHLNRGDTHLRTHRPCFQSALLAPTVPLQAQHSLHGQSRSSLSLSLPSPLSSPPCKSRCCAAITQSPPQRPRRPCWRRRPWRRHCGGSGA